MSKFEIVTKYIDLLENDKFGEWFVDKENDGSKEHPIQMPFVMYSQVVHGLIEDTHRCAKDTGIRNYGEILEKHNIEWGQKSMKNADVISLPAEAIFALLLGAVRAERFCDGVLLAFIHDGSILKWLTELKCKDEGK